MTAAATVAPGRTAFRLKAAGAVLNYCAPSNSDPWRLTGPSGVVLDELVCTALALGLNVETIEPGVAYRVTGDPATRAGYAEFVSLREGFAISVEMPPVGVVRLASRRLATRPAVRETVVHGSSATVFTMAARALDACLSVRCVGLMRYSVAGPTSAQVQWLATATGKTAADVLADWGLTAAEVAAEDASPLTVAVVELPDRESTTTVERDGDGAIVRSTTIERTPQ